MKTILHILLLSFGLIANGFGQSQADLLETAYKKKSIDMLTKFFDNWSNEIKSNELTYQNDTILEAFKVFKGFYKPTQLSLLGGSEWGDSLYINSKYFLVQTKLDKIKFTDKIFYTDKEIDSITVCFYKKLFENDTIRLKNELKRDTNGRFMPYVYENWKIDYDNSEEYVIIDSIDKFYPPIDYPDNQTVYLTEEYRILINRFLGNSHKKFGQGGIMNPARSKGASRKRKAFIDNLITTFYGHWGGYWQLDTYPYAYSITFDKHMEYARVDFKMVYEGGEAIMKKQDNKWIIIKGELTLIE